MLIYIKTENGWTVRF